MKSCELSEGLKNQGLAKNFANPLQSGWRRRAICELCIFNFEDKAERLNSAFIILILLYITHDHLYL